MNDTTTQKKKYADLSVVKKPGSEVEITGEVPVDASHGHRVKAIKKIIADLELPGFRKGHVPEEMAVSHVGEAAIMQEVAETALSETFAQIIEDEKLDVVGRPNVTITKLAPGNPIGFKITSALYPELSLPDYKKIAEKELGNHDDPMKVEVSEVDIEEELKRLQEMMTPKTNQESGTKEQESSDDAQDDGAKQQTEPKAPEINDEFAQQLGDFKDLADLKEKIKKGMHMEKQNKAREMRRIAIADAIIAKTKLEVPDVFINGELDQMVASFDERVKRAGMEMDAYLEQAKKTMEDLRKEWRPDAEKRAKLQLILAEIAKHESLAPDTKKLEREIAHIKEHYPDAEEHAVRSYVGAQILNDMVFALLEGRDPHAPVAQSHSHESEHDHGHGDHDHSDDK